MSAAAPKEADRRLVDVMVAYQKGEMEGFEQLFHALATSVRNYLASLCRDFGRAEDLLQETFLQVHRARHTYSPPRPVKPWIFGIARYVYLMDRRSKIRKSKFETTANAELPELPVDSISEGLPVTDDLLRALEGVSEDRREAVLLHHVWGFSFREIGAMLGISERAAKLRSFRGIQTLRAIMSEGEAG